LLENPEGLPLARLASLVSDAETAGYDNTDYKFASRFVRRSEHVSILDKSGGSDAESAESGGSRWVEPRASAFTCLRGKHQVSNPPKPREGSAIETRAGVNTSSRGTQFSKARARSYLSRHMQVHSDSVRRSLGGALATELASIEDKYTVLERTSSRSDLPEHLLVPYTTRFNDAGRAAESRADFDAAWLEAAERHESAVMCTLTTDPSLHSSAIEAVGALTDTLQSLSRWLSRDVSAEWAPDRVGRRLPYLSALEWTESGLPHLHVVFFGARSLCSQDALSAYLSDKTGRVVWFDTLDRRNDRWLWSNPSARPSDASAATQPREYLSEALRGQQALAGMSASEARDALADVDSGLWKLALYWASGKQLWTASEGLQAAESGDRADDSVVDRGLPHVAQYRFIGVSQYRDLPAHVRESAVMLGRPPPDGGGPPRT
jgi:hypothetical protein